MTIKERLILWLLARLIGPSAKRKEPIPGSVKSEVKTCNHIAYESMIQSITSRSTQAQLYFMHMYLRNLPEETLGHVSRYAMFITRNREQNVDITALRPARSYSKGERGRPTSKPPDPSVQSRITDLLDGPFGKGLDGLGKGKTGSLPRREDEGQDPVDPRP